MTPQVPASNVDPWRDFLGDVRNLGLDYLRFKYMDVEQPSDDRNIPDQADLRYGPLSERPTGGLTIGAWLVIGLVAVVAVLIVSRLK